MGIIKGREGYGVSNSEKGSKGRGCSLVIRTSKIRKNASPRHSSKS